LQEVEHVGARHLAAVAHGDHLTDLSQCQTDRLSAADERQSVQRVGS
jgi:hypothetical protein